MEKFLVLVVVLLIIYNLLKPNKKQSKNANTFQDLQKLLSNFEQQPKTTKTINQSLDKSQNYTSEKKTYTSLETTNVEVVNYDDITLTEYIETKKRNKGFEDLENSESYQENTDTKISFEKENNSWLKQLQKDNAEHSDKHTQKTKLTSKDIKKAYIISQIMERKTF